MRRRTLAIYDESAADTVRTLFLLRQHPTFSHFDVFTFSSPKALLSSTIPFDIALLEIGTQTPNGFELAKTLQSRPNCPAIVFITNDPSYVYQGYEVAKGYLLKPLNQETFSRALSRVARMMPRIQFSGKGSQGIHVFRIEDIRYIEAKDHTVVIHAGGDCITLSLRFSSILNQLPSDFFVTSCRGLAVNLMHVASLEGTRVVLSDGTEIAVSRRAVDQVQQALSQFLQTYRD